MRQILVTVKKPEIRTREESKRLTCSHLKCHMNLKMMRVLLEMRTGLNQNEQGVKPKRVQSEKLWIELCV